MLKVNTVVKYKDVKLKVTPSSATSGMCTECYFYKMGKSTKDCSDFLIENDDYCTGYYRKDRTNVIFKEVTK